MKKQTKEANFIVPLVVYPFDIMFSFGEGIGKLKSKLRGFVPPSDINQVYLGKAQGRTIQFSSGQVLIIIKEYPCNSNGLSILQHEIFHAIQFVFDKIGIKHSDESTEAYAYAIQYVTNQAYQKIKVSVA